MTVKIQRTWHGYATIRNYQAREAYFKGEDLIIQCQEQQMVISNKDIMSKGHELEKEYTSIHDGMKYKLWDYIWKPQFEQLSI